MNTYEALCAMENGKEVANVGDLSKVRYRKRCGIYEFLNHDGQWELSHSKSLNEEWGLYVEPLKYVGYKDAFDALVEGKIVSFEGDRFAIHSSIHMIHDGGAANITPKMLTEKKWVIED